METDGLQLKVTFVFQKLYTSKGTSLKSVFF